MAKIVRKPSKSWPKGKPRSGSGWSKFVTLRMSRSRFRPGRRSFTKVQRQEHSKAMRNSLHQRALREVQQIGKAQQIQICEAYEKGETFSRIVKETGCKSSVIEQIFAQCGISRRTKFLRALENIGPSIHGGFLQGLFIQELVDRHNLSHQMIFRILKSQGVCLRQGWAWKSEKSRAKVIRKILSSGGTQPNRVEARLLHFLSKYSFQYRYNGRAASLVIRGKVPDFANIIGEKKVIELFGDFYHRADKAEHGGDDGEGRRELFARSGYRTLIIWEHELEDESVLLEKVAKFDGYHPSGEFHP